MVRAEHVRGVRKPKGTVVVGMLLRRVAAQGTAPSFVVVATVVLAALLLSWRLVARLLPA